MSETIDLRVLFDAARPGDVLPDPGWPCGVPDNDDYMSWVCNRATGHKPGTQHVATASGTVVAVWTGGVPSPAAPTSDVLQSVLDGLRARVAATICGAVAYCRCGQGAGHTEPHACADAKCGGRWTGDIDGDDFVVHQWPGVAALGGGS